MEQVNGPVCVVCGGPADTIRDRHDYCGQHHAGHMPATPVVVCALDGCGSPAVAKVGARDLCAYHAARLAA
jgi:hypothetical protein